MGSQLFSSSQVKRIGTLCFASFFAEGANILVTISIVYYLRARYGLTASEIGIAVSIMTVSYTLFCMIFERFYERLKPSLCLCIAFVIESLTCLVIASGFGMPIVYVCLILYGYGKSFLWPQLTGWMNRGLEKDSLNRATGFFNLSWSVGSAIAPFIAGTLVMTQPNLPIFCAFVINLILFVVILAFPQSRTVSSDVKQEKEVSAEDNSTALRFFTWAGLLGSYIVRGPMESVFTLYAQEKLGILESQAGLMLTVRGLVTTAVFVLMSRTRFWQFSKTVIFASQIALGVLVLWATTIAQQYLFWIYFPILGVCLGFIYNLSLFHSLSGSIHKSRRMMIHESVLTVGQVLGSSIGGKIYQIHGWKNLLLNLSESIFIILMIEVIALLLIKKGRKVEKRTVRL